MGKPSSNWQHTIVYGDDVTNWLDKKIIIGTSDRFNYDVNYLNKLLLSDNSKIYQYDQKQDIVSIMINKGSSSNLSYVDAYYSLIKRYMTHDRPNSRIIGVIDDVNEDGSYLISLYGNNVTLRPSNFKDITLIYRIFVRTGYDNDEDKIGIFPSIPTWGNIAQQGNMGISQNYYYTPTNGFDVVLNKSIFENFGLSTGSAFFQWHCTERNSPVGTGSLNLTTDINTVQLGVPRQARRQNFFKYPNINLGLLDNAIEGNIFDLMLSAYNNTILRYSNFKYGDGAMQSGQYYIDDITPDMVTTFNYAQYWMMFNVPLTNSTSQAIRYVNSGELPDDVFLYPFDLDSLPTSDGISPDNGGDSIPSDPTDENGDNGIHGKPTQDAIPAVTSNQLNNNNLYWLQAGQLEQFITWFWQNAGQILDVNDLWQNIQGLYNNLAEAVINIRYYPVDVQYIGGAIDTSNIIISSVSMPIDNIKMLSKTKLSKRTLGSIEVSHKYNAFTDYSPYTSISLYLPFHGWVNLDIDIFIGNKLEVRCIYDHMSGTIQYGIYVISGGNEWLVNSVVAKMAVDIPITLQSKHERDSAIFTNVASAVGSLMGAGASIASTNPVGLVMSTASIGIGGTQSAPIHTMGTVGENGAFFTPNKCSIYIKRPSYNRPSNYASCVGFPSNTGGKLSTYKGYTTVYNPHITFTGNVNNDGVLMKPLDSEIEEIYTLLEKGVIL